VDVFFTARHCDGAATLAFLRLDAERQNRQAHSGKYAASDCFVQEFWTEHAGFGGMFRLY
jgi:hypothetical protein